MTDFDHATLDLVLPSPPGAADWDDVVSRFRMRRSRRRRGALALLAAVFVVAVGTASAFGSARDFLLGIGSIGLPAPGATPSTPENGHLVAYWDLPLGYSRTWLYADGRLIRWGEVDVNGTGIDPLPTGFVEQKLTPEGVRLMRSEILSAGTLGAGEPAPGSDRVPGGFHNQLFVRDGDGFLPLTWTGEYARLQERLLYPEIWLPASAWEGKDPKPYVASRFSACFMSSTPVRPSRMLALLPAEAQSLLRAHEIQGWIVNRLRSRPDSDGRACAEMTTEEARALTNVLAGAGLEQIPPGTETPGYAFGPGERWFDRYAIVFQPCLPHGEFVVNSG